MSKDSNSCVVCGTAVDAEWTAYCQNCDGIFHFRQREDMAGEDCGEAALNPEFMVLEFACSVCIAGEEEGGAALAAVITAGEAAMLAGMSEGEVVALAEAGELAHREAGGVYLFERVEIERLVAGREA